MRYVLTLAFFFGLTTFLLYSVDFLNHTTLSQEFYVAGVAEAGPDLQNKQSAPNTPVTPDAVSILNFGDGMFGRGVGKAMLERGLDPFALIKQSEIWDKADLIVLNLEGPISDNLHCQEKAYSFRFEPETANMLANNKIGAVNLANNHSLDCYERGLSDTKTFLWLSGVNYFGGGEEVEGSFFEKEVAGRKIGFVGINLTFDPKLNPKYLGVIRELKERDNFVIVNIHWGTEYSKSDVASQKIAGRAIIDAGANVIIGHHPHVIEPVEIYNNKPIFYSLGNFVFDQLEPENNEGLGVKISLRDGRVPLYEILPYIIENMQPKFSQEAEAESFCAEFLKNYSGYRTGPCGLEI